MTCYTVHTWKDALLAIRLLTRDDYTTGGFATSFFPRPYAVLSGPSFDGGTVYDIWSTKHTELDTIEAQIIMQPAIDGNF